MKLTKERIHALSQTLVRRLEGGKHVKWKTDHAPLIKRIEQTITNELILEDQLNQEVERILKAYHAEFETGRVDYHRMFQMTKKQLAEERGIIL
jgi:uncharacterized protein